MRLIAECKRNGTLAVFNAAGGLLRSAMLDASSACAALSDDFAGYDCGHFTDLDAIVEHVADTQGARNAARAALQQALDALDGMDEAELAANGSSNQRPPNYIEGESHAQH